jgi:hypothetical protein
VVRRYGSMYKVLLVLLILVLNATSADAHHRRHHYHVLVPYSYVSPHNDTISRPEPPTSSRNSKGDVIPADWKKQSLDGASNGGRVVSPDGLASFDFYTTAAGDQPITEHMKSFAFGNSDEIITSLAGERAWIAASGFKGDRLFYRKAVLTCGGDRWHHIAFEYPGNAKRNMQDFIRRAVEMLDGSQNDGCDTPLTKWEHKGFCPPGQAKKGNC